MINKRGAKNFHETISAARTGLALGYVLALAYAFCFVSFAIARSSWQIVVAMTWGAGVIKTILLSALSLATGALAFGLVIAVVPAVLQMVAFLLLSGLTPALNPGLQPGRASRLGMAVAAGIAFLFNLMVVWLGGSYILQLGVLGYLYWFGLPSLIFVAATGWVWRVYSQARFNSSRDATPDVGGVYSQSAA